MRGKITLNPITTIRRSARSNPSGMTPRNILWSWHLVLLCPVPPLSSLYVSPTVVWTLKRVSRSKRSGQWTDIDMRDATAVLQVLRRQGPPSCELFRRGNAAARSATLSSVKRNEQPPAASQNSLRIRSLTKFQKLTIDDKEAKSTAVPSRRSTNFNVSLVGAYEAVDLEPFERMPFPPDARK